MQSEEKWNGWVYGTFDVSIDGMITNGNWERSHDGVSCITGGTLSIDSFGEVNGSLTTELGGIQIKGAKLNATKNVIVCVDAATEALGFGVLIKGNVAPIPPEEPPPPPPPGDEEHYNPGSASGGGGGGCFIATAAFGTPMTSEVRILCRFRDSFLLTNAWGRRFVRFYYRNSPPIADYIAKKDGLKALIRVCLKPLIWLSRILVE